MQPHPILSTKIAIEKLHTIYRYLNEKVMVQGLEAQNLQDCLRFVLDLLQQTQMKLHQLEKLEQQASKEIHHVEKSDEKKSDEQKEKTIAK